MFFAVTHTQKQERILLASTFGRLSYSDTVAQELTLRLKKKDSQKLVKKHRNPTKGHVGFSWENCRDFPPVTPFFVWQKIFENFWSLFVFFCGEYSPKLVLKSL